MKKSTYLLTLLLTALFCLPWGSNAWADELTVADGTSRSGYLPFYGNYTDASNLLCQSLYLKDELADLANTNITKLTFYTDGESDFSWDGHVTFTVSMAEVEETAINSTLTPTLTEVYSGGLSIVSTLTTINFPDAFYYSGDGNLLIEIKVISTDKTYHNAYYLGVSTGGNWDGYYAGRVNYNTSSTGYKFRPKTTFTYEAAAAVTCAKPSDLTNTALSASSATFTWTAGGSESEWQYICLPAATAVDWESASVQTTTSATATVGLSPTTDYKFYVRANCGATDGVSKEISVAFTTPCASITLPWYLDLSDVTSNTILDCWDISGSTSTTKSGSSSYNIWGVYSAGGAKMLRMNNYSVQAGTALINTPNIVVPNDGKNYELVFDYENSAYKSTTNLSLYVKASTDGGSTFTELGSYEKNSSVSYDGTPADFVEETVSLADYAGETIILQFFANANYGYGAMFVKNIRIRAASSCTKPSALSCTAVTANSATLSWTAGGSETAWNIRYKADGDADWSEVAVTAAQLVDGKYTIPGLSDNTHYTAQVQANCGGEQSEWNSTAVSFTTLCNPFTMKFTENFDDLTAGIPDCWDNAEGTTTNDAYKWNYFATGYSGKCVRFEALYNANGNDNYLKTPLITISEAALLSFRYKNPKGAALSVYYTVDGGEKQVLISSLETKTGWSDAVEQNLPDACIGHQVSICFKAVSNCSYGDAYIYLDNVEVKKQPTCLTPTALNYSNVTAESVTLSWTAGGTETAWKVQYSTNNSDWSDAVDATTNPFTLPDLSEQTTYYVRVAANCGDSESEYTSTTVSFKTKCAAISSFPWTEDFEDETNETNVACWDNSASTCFSNTGGSTPSKYVWGVVTASGNKLIYMRNFNVRAGTALINTPSFTLPSDKNYELSFKYSHLASCDPLVIKVSENGGAFNAVAGASYAASGSTSYSDPGVMTEASIDLSAYKGKTITLQFFTTANWGDGAIWVDDLSIHLAPSCFKPALNEASAITPDGATFTWTESGKGETQYQYICVPSGETPNWSAATLTSALTATVSGKAAGTYDFYVRSYCGTDDQSEAVSKSFTTATVPAPTGVNVTGITNNSASASWTAPDVTYPVQYQWKTSKTGSVWSTPSSDLSAALSGLEANTDYTFYVRTYYSASLQSAEATQVFHTACEAVTVDATHPFAEDFNGLTTAGEIPSCWDNSEVVLPPYTTAPTAARKWSYFATGHEGKCVRYNSAEVSSGVVNVLATPQIILNADADLVFWMKNKKGGDYTVEISVNGNPRTELIASMTSVGDWTKQESPLTPYVGNTIQLFFCGTSNWSESNDGYLYLDDVQINPVSCRKPAADPVVDSKDAVSATISWPAVAGAAKYQFSLVERDAAPVWEDANTVTTTSKELTGLQPSTSYDFYVRTYCDAESQSEARKVSFRTGCGVITALPWEENFESVTLEGNIPECWDKSLSTLVSYSYEWKLGGNYSGRNGGKAMQCGLAVEEAGKQNILATPSIQLGTGNVLSFWCKKSAGDSFVVEISADGGSTKTQLIDLTSEALTDWTLKYADLSAYNNEEVILYFTATSAGDYAGDMIYIDNVRVARGEFFDDAATSGVETRIAGLEGETLDFIMNRPMQFEGSYNTLCLPFDLSAAELADADCPLYRNTVKVFDYARVASNELQLAIAGASDIRAGVPCFVKYDGAAGEPRSLFLFKDVTIKTGLSPKADGAVEYRGIYDPVAVTAEQDNGPHHYIFVGAGNQLYWPGTDRTMRGFRAYFYVGTEDLAGNPIKRGIPARLVERTDTATGIGEISSQPSDTGSQKVLENSRIVIIRNGVKYNVQGQLIEKR